MNKQLRSALFILAFAVILAAAFALLEGVAGTASVQAQAPTPTDDQVNAIAKQLYCPVCENTPLDVCPTEACRQWRELIRKQLGEGWTEDQIKQYFVANYGARVLDEPPRTGWNWLVYVLPPVLILAGAVLLLRAMRTWTKAFTAKAPSNEEPVPPGQDEYVARLEKELRERK
jgi:cytochrome c-type biogenesis protein CcmH